MKSSVRLAVAAAAVAALAPPGLALLPAAQAVDAGSPVVISEVYGGGGNSGAPYSNDFVELYNHGTSAVSVDGWSVQYTSSTGTSYAGPTALAGSIDPGAYYLVQEAAGATPSQALPTPDATGTLALSSSSGKVALVDNTTPLTCGSDCDAAAGVVDFVGYGAANDSAGQPAPGLSNTTSDQRTISPYADSGNNAADFSAASPTPKAAPAGPPANPCATQPLPDQCVPGSTTIQDIQGPGFLSPLRGQSVSKVPGIVTATRTTGNSKGFWIQEATPDTSRPSASSGLFVYSSSATVAVGDSVLVTGKVSDYYTLSSGETLSTTSSLSTTELSPTLVTTVSFGNPVPAALVLRAGTVPGRYAPTVDGGNIESIATVDPTRSALEFYEAHEGMLVSVADARVVGPGKPQYGEIYVTTKPKQQATPRGGTYLPGYAGMPSGRLLVAPASGVVPPANVGDVLFGTTSGPVDWSPYGGYDIVATTVGTRLDKGLQPTSATAQTSDQLAVATYNVENLTPQDSAGKYQALATGVVDRLKTPDIIAVEEIQDNSGSTDDGTVAADQTLTELTNAIVAAGGPTYQWAEIDPVNDADGGQPGGNIRSVFLYNPARVTFADKPAGTATGAVTVSKGSDGTPELSVNPGRVDPTNEAWTDSRKPLTGEFVFHGAKVIVVANHFNSKGGDQSADGRFQPPTRSSEVQRTKQALVLKSFVNKVLRVDPQANVVLAGDFNDYQFSGPVRKLTGNGSILTDLITTLPANQQYTYVYNGISQVLDHVFVSKALSGANAEYDVVHINSEFANQVSDHDPQVARLRPVGTTTPPSTTTLNLLNINDFHGRIDGNTVKFAGTVEKLRAAGGAANTLLLSAGDNVSASLFASAIQGDQPTIDVLNALGLNGSAVGNHEFDKGYADLVDRISNGKKNASWDYLGANVYTKGTTTPALPEYATYVVDGITVGVIGAVTQETPSLVSPGGISGLDFGDPVDAVNRVAAQLTDGNPANGEADVLVAEYHEGASEGTPDGATLEQEVAAGGAFAKIVTQTSPKVAAIFTGHTHKVYAWQAPVPGSTTGATRPVLQTGDYGENVGHVTLTVDTATKQVTGYTEENVARTTDADADLIAAYPRVAAVDTITKAALAYAAAIGDQPIGKVTADITTAYSGGNRDDRGSESTLGNTVANALRDELSGESLGGAQIGVVNPGGLRAELLYGEDGTVTYAEANSVLPFVNNLWTLSLTGTQFKTVLEQMWQPAGSSRPFLNLGLSDNVTYTYDAAAAQGSHITSITVDGKPIDPAASYRIGTFSFLGTGGDNFTEFTQATDVRDTGLVDRDAWIDYLKTNSPLSPSFARRGVQVTDLPSSLTAGQATSFELTKLDLTSLGSPANTSVTASIGSTTVGTAPVTGGAATLSVTVPQSLTGSQTLTVVAQPSGTTVTIPVSVTGSAEPGSVAVFPPFQAAGGQVLVYVSGWAPGVTVTGSLDGTVPLGSTTTDGNGAALGVVTIPATTATGLHQVVVTAPGGLSASASVYVVAGASAATR